MKEQKNKSKIKPKPEKQTVVSKVLGNNHMLELIYAPRLEKTSFAYWDGKAFSIRKSYASSNKLTLYPVKPSNNLIKHKVVKLASYSEDYGNVTQLISEIRTYIHKYVDLPTDFEIVAAHYVLLTWVYDRFRELPYLRLLGDYGTGKTRFLLTVGSLCYKPIFASGASTTSPIFHSLDSFNGTLILDEADFRFSDAKAEMVKILNNGNVKGFPVLRCEVSKTGQYNPRAFQVFGPKIIATRSHYQDPALESRLITSSAKAGSVRQDIPINLPDEFEVEAQSLRNKLLMFRFKHWHRIDPRADLEITVKENRIAQIFRPLLAMAQDDKARDAILRYAQKSQSYLKHQRSHSPEERLLTVITKMMKTATPLSVKTITKNYAMKFGHEHSAPISPKWVGGIIRSRLHLTTIKRHGNYVIDDSQLSKIRALCERYDIQMVTKSKDETPPAP